MGTLTQWGRVTHICVSKPTIIGSDNGLSPARRQAIIWTNAGILLIEPFGTNFIEIRSKIQNFSFIKMHLKMSSAKWWPFCLDLNVLIIVNNILLSRSIEWIFVMVIAYCTKGTKHLIIKIISGLASFKGMSLRLSLKCKGWKSFWENESHCRSRWYFTYVALRNSSLSVLLLKGRLD